jgi:hypothetical protein
MRRQIDLELKECRPFENGCVDRYSLMKASAKLLFRGMTSCFWMES